MSLCVRRFVLSGKFCVDDQIGVSVFEALVYFCTAAGVKGGVLLMIFSCLYGG